MGSLGPQARVAKSVEFVRETFARLQQNLWLPALLARLAMAGEFIPSGFGKVTDLPKLIAYFVQLGIPAPALTAALSSTTELVCGVLLLLGLATRFAALALTIVMTVAILTARLPDVHGVGDFFYLPEVAYIVIFAWLVFAGAGEVSVDHWIRGRAGQASRRDPASWAASRTKMPSRAG
ncbi:MAG TPA: DoxX family protein [Polyangiaceae bacterium]|jgi:putative oxidoreductase|nr:DoxX family protein [Polyangiaceae bacterium]